MLGVTCISRHSIVRNWSVGMCNSANKAARSRPLFLVFFFCLSFFWGGTRACVSVRMRVREKERERQRLCVSVSAKLTFCFRRLQESQARAVLCRLSSGTLGRVMRGERSAVHPTDALFAKPGIVPFL
ncbi:hypothetical protein CI102_14097 [Trichoderma harzianum]|nr:hypothetical protein CI102_14097 [Trichoderma harzianum]